MSKRLVGLFLALVASIALAADVKISALPAVSSALSTTDLLIANEGSTTRKATPPQVVAASVSGNGLLNRTGSTTVAAYAGTSCTNQFVRSLSAAGAATCATVGTSDIASSVTLTTPNIGAATGTSVSLSGTATMATLTNAGDVNVRLNSTGGSGKDWYVQSRNASGNFAIRNDTGSVDGLVITPAGAISSPTFVTPTLGAASATSINFGDTSLANYKEGTFSITLRGDGTAGTYTIDSTTAVYTRIGRMVFVNLTIDGLSAASGGTGNLEIATSGLPCSAARTAIGSTGNFKNIDFDGTASYVQAYISGSTLAFFHVFDNAAATRVPISSVTAGDRVISFTINYECS